MTNSSERVLLDTNVLIYAMDEVALHHEACRQLRDRALSGEVLACLAPQVLMEYLVVVTNPKQVSAPLAMEEALSDLEQLADRFECLAPPPDLHRRVIALMRSASLPRKQIYDAALAATALAHGVQKLCSYDVGFDHIPGITRVTP